MLAFALIFVAGFYAINAEAQMGPWMMGRGCGKGPAMMGWGGYGGWYCPYCGRPMGPWMMGPGMTGRRWMGPGYGPHYGPHYGPQYQQPQRPMEEKDARTILENYLASMRNPNLKLGEIKDVGYAFEGEILTKDDSLVDKRTGWICSVY